MRELTYTVAAREGLAEEMARDPTIFVVGQGVGARGGNFNTTVGLFDLYGPERLRDVTIAERGFPGICTGAAMTGTRPVVDYMFFDFALDALGELINQTAKIQYMSSGRLKMPIVLRGCIGAGGASATHHSGSYYNLFTNQAGFRVVAPTTPRDAKGLLKTAIRCDDPVIFMEHKSLLNLKGLVPDPEADECIPFGQARIARDGSAATVVAIAGMAPKVLAACDELAREGVEIEVIDPRTLAPLDIDTVLASVHKTGRLLVVDETYAPCGIGAEIAAQVMARGFDDLDAPVMRLNGPQTPIPYSPPLEARLNRASWTTLRSLESLNVVHDGERAREATLGTLWGWQPRPQTPFRRPPSGSCWPLRAGTARGSTVPCRPSSGRSTCTARRSTCARRSCTTSTWCSSYPSAARSSSTRRPRSQRARWSSSPPTASRRRSTRTPRRATCGRSTRPAHW